MMKRTLRRELALAPQNVSTTYNFLPESSFTASSLRDFQVSSVTGLLSFLYSSEVHHTVFLLTSSITKNLSLGERPV